MFVTMLINTINNFFTRFLNLINPNSRVKTFMDGLEKTGDPRKRICRALEFTNIIIQSDNYSEFWTYCVIGQIIDAFDLFTQPIIQKMRIRKIVVRQFTDEEQLNKNHGICGGYYEPNSREIHINISERAHLSDRTRTTIHELMHVIDQDIHTMHDTEFSKLHYSDRCCKSYAREYGKTNCGEDKSTLFEDMMLFNSSFNKTKNYQKKTELLTKKLIQYHPDFESILSVRSGSRSKIIVTIFNGSIFVYSVILLAIGMAVESSCKSHCVNISRHDAQCVAKCLPLWYNIIILPSPIGLLGIIPVQRIFNTKSAIRFITIINKYFNKSHS